MHIDKPTVTLFIFQIFFSITALHKSVLYLIKVFEAGLSLMVSNGAGMRSPTRPHGGVFARTVEDRLIDAGDSSRFVSRDDRFANTFLKFWCDLMQQQCKCLRLIYEQI